MALRITSTAPRGRSCDARRAESANARFDTNWWLETGAFLHQLAELTRLDLIPTANQMRGLLLFRQSSLSPITGRRSVNFRTGFVLRRRPRCTWYGGPPEPSLGLCYFTRELSLVRISAPRAALGLARAVAHPLAASSPRCSMHPREEQTRRPCVSCAVAEPRGCALLPRATPPNRLPRPLPPPLTRSPTGRRPAVPRTAERRRMRNAHHWVCIHQRTARSCRRTELAALVPP
jgi:hypothetical protein